MAVGGRFRGEFAGVAAFSVWIAMATLHLLDISRADFWGPSRPCSWQRPSFIPLYRRGLQRI